MMYLESEVYFRVKYLFYIGLAKVHERQMLPRLCILAFSTGARLECNNANGFPSGCVMNAARRLMNENINTAYIYQFSQTRQAESAVLYNPAQITVNVLG